MQNICNAIGERVNAKVDTYFKIHFTKMHEIINLKEKPLVCAMHKHSNHAPGTTDTHKHIYTIIHKHAHAHKHSLKQKFNTIFFNK